jgi:hypothetical protein
MFGRKPEVEVVDGKSSITILRSRTLKWPYPSGSQTRELKMQRDVGMPSMEPYIFVTNFTGMPADTRRPFEGLG